MPNGADWLHSLAFTRLPSFFPALTLNATITQTFPSHFYSYMLATSLILPQPLVRILYGSLCWEGDGGYCRDFVLLLGGVMFLILPGHSLMPKDLLPY